MNTRCGESLSPSRLRAGAGMEGGECEREASVDHHKDRFRAQGVQGVS